MGTTLKRTGFVSRVDGKLRPQEWSMIIDSNFGVMVEPNWCFRFAQKKQAGGLRNDDFTDQHQRVDELVEVDDNVLPKLLSGGGTTLIHGGRHWPRDGR